ncbi:MAG: ROK family protein [Verrucomicrobia bacterium]|nr:ROK family protein [Verrucomicrobiota bacterium]
MNHNHGLELVSPRITPVLDAAFRPAVLANRAFREAVRASKTPVPVRLALEQADGSTGHFVTEIFPENHPQAVGNCFYLERLVKFLLWSRGGFRIYLAGPKSLGDQLQKHFFETSTGRFDSNLLGEKVYGRPLEVVTSNAADIPPARANTIPLGGHWDGCRIGFDLGASDRKVAAIIEGKPVFSEEVLWNPVPQMDPQWHFDQIMDSLKRAAAHLPRVDSIGGSSAGILVNNRVKVASLFRGVPRELFNPRITDIFLELQKAWGGIPFEVVNDGEVTALAGSMAIGQNAVLGIAMGSSQAAGYVTPDGNITSRLNELAFAPIDYGPTAPVDEWSGDRGCGVQYFSQQAVGRLIPAAGIEVDAAMPLPEQLKHVQSLMQQGDGRARKIYQTIGTYLGYGLAHYADFYEFKHVLILGRVTSGHGGDIIIESAKEVLRLEFPELTSRVAFHLPEEKEKRHGQAVAAASLPIIRQP